MAARGVKTKVTDNDGSDFAYRQTIEDKYHLMARLKAAIRGSQTGARTYFVLALAVSVVHFVAHTQSPWLLRFHPLLYGMSPLPLLSLEVIASIVVYQALSAIQHSASTVMLHFSALLAAMLLVLTIALPLSRKAPPLTTVDWMVVGMHAIGLSIVAYGLYNAFRLSRLSRQKRL